MVVQEEDNNVVVGDAVVLIEEIHPHGLEGLVRGPELMRYLQLKRLHCGKLSVGIFVEKVVLVVGGKVVVV